MKTKHLPPLEESVADAIHRLRKWTEDTHNEDLETDTTCQRQWDTARYETRCALLREIALQVGAALARANPDVDIPVFVDHCLEIKKARIP